MVHTLNGAPDLEEGNQNAKQDEEVEKGEEHIEAGSEDKDSALNLRFSDYDDEEGDEGYFDEIGVATTQIGETLPGEELDHIDGVEAEANKKRGRPRKIRVVHNEHSIDPRSSNFDEVRDSDNDSLHFSAGEGDQPPPFFHGLSNEEISGEELDSPYGKLSLVESQGQNQSQTHNFQAQNQSQGSIARITRSAKRKGTEGGNANSAAMATNRSQTQMSNNKGKAATVSASQAKAATISSSQATIPTKTHTVKRKAGSISASQGGFTMGKATQSGKAAHDANSKGKATQKGKASQQAKGKAIAKSPAKTATRDAAKSPLKIVSTRATTKVAASSAHSAPIQSAQDHPFLRQKLTIRRPWK
ncbi:hypothetical protein RIF29_20747 [Crotalaria pallida]|uniref:Uncharacterized protein n=1 Tax=Crotalaria pallida TaxID=3830 RepID=A0AAN9F220_CROPI